MKLVLSAILGSLVLAGVACSGAPLGGRGSGGSGGSGAPPCTVFTGCGTGFGGDIAAGGAAGSDAGDSSLCSQLTDAYSAAVTAARACTPGAPNQCQAQVSTVPMACPGSVCGEEAFVNDATEVEAVRGKWLAACEPNVRLSCIQIACAPPLAPSVCVPTGGPGTATGSCLPSDSSDGGSADASGTDGALDGGESCDQLAADYTAAVTAARACTPGAPNQCQSTVSATVSACPRNGCGPDAYVNNATGVNAVRTRWLTQCGGGVVCPKIVCLPLALAVACVPVDGGTDTTTGLCVSGVQPTN